LMKSHCNY